MLDQLDQNQFDNYYIDKGDGQDTFYLIEGDNGPQNIDIDGGGGADVLSFKIEDQTIQLFTQHKTLIVMI